MWLLDSNNWIRNSISFLDDVSLLKLLLEWVRVKQLNLCRYSQCVASYMLSTSHNDWTSAMCQQRSSIVDTFLRPQDVCHKYILHLNFRAFLFTWIEQKHSNDNQDIVAYSHLTWEILAYSYLVCLACVQIHNAVWSPIITGNANCPIIKQTNV